jgi:metal-responsive CopG/Arc/MetJ family transcriptional regulator
MTNEKVRMNLTLKKSVVTKLNLLANIENKTRNEYLEELILNSLNENKDKMIAYMETN